MTTITTQQIAERLSKSFTDVAPLKRIDTGLIDNSTDSRTITVINYEGLQLAVGVFTNDEDLDNANYTRVVCAHVNGNSLAYQF